MQKNPGYAHSMGALIALDYLPTGQALLTGAVISGAPIAPVGAAKPILVVLAKVLSRVWPTFTLRTQLDAEAISRDPKAVLAYRTDPLVHGVASARWGTDARRSPSDSPFRGLWMTAFECSGDGYGDRAP